jgi:acyl-CoA thioesterase I
MSDMKQKILLLCIAAMCTNCGDKQPAPPASRPAPAPESVPAHALTPAPARRHTILFLGTSLTAGYGIGAQNAFPAIVQQKLDSAKLPYRVVNAGLSGETSAGGLRRLDWTLQQPVDVLVLELGANDGLRGLSVSQMKANLDSIMERTRARYPEAAIVLAGMQAPPNLGAAYTHNFRAAFTELARKYDAVLIPFLLDDVAAKPELNQPDAIHPNAAGHRIIAETVWTNLKPVLTERMEAAAKE